MICHFVCGTIVQIVQKGLNENKNKAVFTQIHEFIIIAFKEGIMELKSNDQQRKEEILKFLDSFETKVEDTIKLYDAWVICMNK